MKASIWKSPNAAQSRLPEPKRRQASRFARITTPAARANGWRVSGTGQHLHYGNWSVEWGRFHNGKATPSGCRDGGRESSPSTGKLSARPAGQPGCFSIVEGAFCDDPFRAITVTALHAGAPSLRFLRHRGIYRSDVASLLVNLDRGAASRWSGPDQATQQQERDGWSTSCSSSAMSSDRLFLDRVARQQCPSPLHRHAQIIMHFPNAPLKPERSTLLGIGTFYFALTRSGVPGGWGMPLSGFFPVYPPAGKLDSERHLMGHGHQARSRHPLT